MYLSKYSKCIVVLSIFAFLLGMYLYSTGLLSYWAGFLNEEFTEPSTASSCPNLLIKKGGQIHLYNTAAPEQAGINPIVFNSLDQYVTFYNSQKALGVNCQALMLQEETNAQGQTGLRMYPTNDSLLGGGYIPPIGSLANPAPFRIDKNKPLPYDDPVISDKKFNQGMYPGFDPHGFYVGGYTTLDKTHDSTETLFPEGSPNAMDPNWGGVLFTEEKIKGGFYDDNIRKVEGEKV